jgi:hypothetical protein
MVTAKQIQRLSNDMFDRSLITLTAIGDISKKDFDEDLIRC